MRPVSPGARRYDTVTIIFHWLTAVLVLTQWFGAQTIDWFPRGAPRIDARSVHITCGVLLAVVILARIIWRLTGGRHLEPADRGIFAVVSKATHWALYALVVAMLLAGLMLTWARGDTIFNLFKLPPMDPANHGLADQLQDIHATIGWMILALAGLHAAAALFHRIVWKDGVLARMLPHRTWNE
jgi:cytochrome b561